MKKQQFVNYLMELRLIMKTSEANFICVELSRSARDTVMSV